MDKPRSLANKTVLLTFRFSAVSAKSSTMSNALSRKHSIHEHVVPQFNESHNNIFANSVIILLVFQVKFYHLII